MGYKDHKSNEAKQCLDTVLVQNQCAKRVFIFCIIQNLPVHGYRNWMVKINFLLCLLGMENEKFFSWQVPNLFFQIGVLKRKSH